MNAEKNDEEKEEKKNNKKSFLSSEKTSEKSFAKSSKNISQEEEIIDGKTISSEPGKKNEKEIKKEKKIIPKSEKKNEKKENVSKKTKKIKKKHVNVLKKIVRFLEKHPKETFTIPKISKKTKINPSTIYRLYHQGKLKKYVKQIKIRDSSKTVLKEKEEKKNLLEKVKETLMVDRDKNEKTDEEREKFIEKKIMKTGEEKIIKENKPEEEKVEKREKEIEQEKEKLGKIEIVETEIKEEKKEVEEMEKKEETEKKPLLDVDTTRSNITMFPVTETSPVSGVTRNTGVTITGTPKVEEKIPEPLQEKEPLSEETEEEVFEPTKEELSNLIPEDERKKIEEPPDKIAISNTIQMPLGTSTEVWCITGRRSSGKSYSCGKIVEELKRLGIQFVIIDPRGAHSAICMENVKHLTPMAGKTIDMKRFVMTLKAKPEMSVIINLKNLPLKEQQMIVKNYCEEMLLADFKRPHMAIFEEVQDFTPLKRRTEASDSVIRFVKLGRASGYGAILVTQRPASASKEALSQAGIYIVHKVINTKDLQALEDLISFGLRKDKEIVRGILSKVTQFSPGEMVLYAPDYVEENNGVIIGKTGKRRTVHAGVNVPVVPRGVSSEPEVFNTDDMIPSENIHWPGKDEEISSGGTGEESFRETGEETIEEPGGELETEGVEEGETEETEETPLTIESLKSDESFKGVLGVLLGILSGIGTYLGLKHMIKK